VSHNKSQTGLVGLSESDFGPEVGVGVPKKQGHDIPGFTIVTSTVQSKALADGDCCTLTAFPVYCL